MTIKTGRIKDGQRPPEVELKPQDPLLAAPIPHAYALVPHPTLEGMYYAVHLEGVTADKLSHVEPSGRASHGPFQLQRIHQQMELRHRARKWGKA